MAAGSESLYVMQTDGFLTDSDGFLTDSRVEDNESLQPLMSSTKIIEEEEDQNFAENHNSQMQLLAADFYTYLNRRLVTLELET